MQIELKTTKLTKSKINQMSYGNIPINPNIDVLGWVNMDKKRYVIIKYGDSFYKTEYLTKVETEVKGVQFPLEEGGYEFPHLTNIKCYTFNRGYVNFSPSRNEEKNLELYDHIISFKRKTEIAGQIYY